MTNDLTQVTSGVSGWGIRGRQVQIRPDDSSGLAVPAARKAVLTAVLSLILSAASGLTVSAAQAADKDDFVGSILADRSDEDDAPVRLNRNKVQSAPAAKAAVSVTPVPEPSAGKQVVVSVPESVPAATEPAPAPAPAPAEPEPSVAPEPAPAPAPAVPEPSVAPEPAPAPAPAEPEPSVAPESAPTPAPAEPEPSAAPEPAPAPAPAEPEPSAAPEPAPVPQPVEPSAAPAPAPQPAEPAQTEAPAVSAPAPAVQPAEPEKSARDRVREFFRTKQRSPEGAMALAREIKPESKEDQDAVFRLWYYAVQQSHSPAYLPYAKALDPTQVPWGTIRKDPLEAWTFYRKAGAMSELSVLKAWATQESARGNRAAQGLINYLR